MKRLLIVGAGGFGREILEWVRDCNENAAIKVTSIAFLDSNQDALKGYGNDLSIVGDPLDYEPSENDLLVCAIGDPLTKLRVCGSLKGRGGRFITLIHPSAIVGTNNQIGEGCVICPGAVVTTNATLGKFVTLNVHATVGHDAILANGCTLSGHVDITGGAILGEGVFIGSHATILPKVNIGDFAYIGAGSMVARRVRANTTVFGVPAKKLPKLQ